MRSLLLLALLASVPAASSARSVPAAIYTDPPHDTAHPASVTVLHIPTHGVNINGLLYAPPGAGTHPTLVLCHGLPGNEKNLDVAQAARRAGWNAVTFNYRGSWGSPGEFHFAQNLEDADAVLAYLRDAANAAKLGIDVKHMVIAGHSMGGWVTAKTLEHDQAFTGAILISAADMGVVGEMPREQLIADMADNMEALAGVTAQSMADEVATHAQAFRIGHEAQLAGVPLLVLTADDGLAPQTDALVQRIRAAGGRQIDTVHVATDHSWSDRRIELESLILEWLGKH